MNVTMPRCHQSKATGTSQKLQTGARLVPANPLLLRRNIRGKAPGTSVTSIFPAKHAHMRISFAKTTGDTGDRLIKIALFQRIKRCQGVTSLCFETGDSAHREAAL